jgi:hypothetical protein
MISRTDARRVARSDRSACGFGRGFGRHQHDQRFKGFVLGPGGGPKGAIRPPPVPAVTGIDDPVKARFIIAIALKDRDHDLRA